MRHTFPLVCKEWAELYRTQDASPPHETLEFDFRREIVRAAASRQGESRRGLGPATTAEAQEWARRYPFHASRVISWAERRAGSVRKLYPSRVGVFPGGFEGFSSEDLGALVAAVGSSLTEPFMSSLCRKRYEKSFWRSLRDSVVPFGRMRP